VIVLNAQNPSAWTGPTGNNTYLLPGRVPALVDAGVGHPAHLAAIAVALRGSELAVVLVTHGHQDHAGGLPAIAARWPGAQIVRSTESFGDLVSAGDSRLRLVPTPGHSPDHVCFFDEAEGDLYGGDLVRLEGTIVIPASRGGNLRQYLESLRRVRALAPRRLLPGHGPIIDDPARVIDLYIRHRQEREAQVIEALRNGLATPEAIAARLYGELPAAITAAAADTVLAHLVKLEEEAGAALTGGRWTLSRERDRMDSE